MVMLFKNKLFNVLLLVFVLLAVIDFVQSYYYLNIYGFEYEANPLIRNNFSLMFVFVFGVPIIVLCIKLAYDVAIYNNDKRFVYITQYMVLLLIILKIFVVLNNFMVILW